jgi:hypothetical protein
MPLSGATVKLSQGGTIASATTDSNGSATFTGLYAGVITATVDLGGFARLVFRADIRNNVDGANVYSTNSQVLMIPLGGTAQADACMTTQYWKLYANYNIIDDTLGGPQYWSTNSTPTKALPAGPDPNNPTVSYNAVTTQPVYAYLNEYSFIDGYGYNSYAIPIGFTGWDVSNTGLKGNGQVVGVTYENVKWTATVDVNGIYTIKLPASDITNFNNNYYYYLNSTNVFEFAIEFGEFTHDFIQYTDGTSPFIVKNPSTAPPTYASTFIYRINSPGGMQWTSIQSTSLTSAWPFFYSGSLK